MSKIARIDDLYRRHAPSVHRRALRILGNEAEAKEVLQDLFVAMLENPKQIEQRTTWSSYLYAATTHACLNRLRNQRNRARLLEQQGAELSSPGELEAEPRLSLREGLERLPPPLAEVAVYYFLDGLNHLEIAELLGCSRRHVGDLLERAKAFGRAEEVPCSIER